MGPLGQARPVSRIAYVVHDLNDPAVARRVKMLRAAGESVVVMGFYRGETPPDTILDARVIPLGRTADAKLVQRVLAVLRNLVVPGPMLAAARGADVVIGRNLEALALARRVRASLPGARLVYECLDIHRLLLGSSLPARMIQRIEAALLRHIDLLVVSSPAFVRDYFSRRPSFTAPALLVENKVLVIDEDPPEPRPAPAGPPWTIGWLGNLRCRKTFEVLTALAARHDGRIQILVAGRPSPAVFDDLPGALAAAPHCTYLGPYSYAEQADIYARCHFAWMIDWFEEGLNSAWLLPNRLYEAQAFGAVPIALRSVETGRWLERHGVGVRLDDALEEFDAGVASLDAGQYLELRRRSALIPREDLIAGSRDCATLARAISGAKTEGDGGDGSA